MSKTKFSGNPHYELLYIVSNEFSEDEVKPINAKVKQVVLDNGGTVTREEDWGKKRLAYQIKKSGYGYYSLVEFDLPALNLAKVERSLRLANEVLRHQIVRKDPRKARPVIERVREVKTELKPVKEERAAKEKTDLKDLDEKLDKILETSDLL